VQKKFVADAHVVCRYDKGQSIGDEGYVADEGFIENGIDQLAVVAAAIGLASILVLSVGVKLLIPAD